MADKYINIGGHKVSAGIKYSTSEVKTGDVWIDGRPIYRRVIQNTNVTPSVSTNNTNFTGSGTLTDGDELVSLTGYAEYLAGTASYVGRHYILGSSSCSSSTIITNFSGLSYNKNSGLVSGTYTFNNNHGPTAAIIPTKMRVVLIVEYTKTTDRT